MNSQYTEIEMHNIQVAEQEVDEVDLLIEHTANMKLSKPIVRFSHVIRTIFMPQLVPQLHKRIDATVQCKPVPPVKLAEV